MLKRIFNEYKSYIVAFAAVIVLVGVMWIFNFPCPIKYVTGLSCAGCGMSRAYISALKLDFASAFAYHPLWIVLPPAFVAIAILSTKGKVRAASIVFYCMIALFIIVWMIRLVTGDAVVAFDKENSLIGKALKTVMNK